MGKKMNHQAVKSNKDKTLKPVVREATVHLHKLLHDSIFKKKAANAVKVIKTQARKTLFTDDVRIDTELNQHLWRNGVRNLDRRVKVVFERKRNEEDEEAEDAFYTLVRLAK